MNLSGFTVIRNAQIMGYPLLESIRSALPLVDEFVVAVGQSEDGTRQMVESLRDPRIRIVDTFWDPTVQKGGQILSLKTNEALALCRHDWCLYLQADEVLHERDLVAIQSSLKAAMKRPEVEGLLFQYVHFYGSYSVVAQSRRWYRNEVRLVRRSSGIQSFGDAQGFRVRGDKPRVLPSHASVYHYGWVKPPAQMGQKAKLLDRLWHGSRELSKGPFDYERQYGLRPFQGSHPAVMRDLVAAQTWDFDPKRRLVDWKPSDLRLWTSDIWERLTGRRLGEYRPYVLLDR